MTHWLFRNMLLNLHVFMNFPVFFLRLTPGFTPLWLEMMLGMTLIFLHLLRLVLWPNIQSILERIPVHLRRACILLLPDGKFCPCLLGLSALMCYLCPVMSPSRSQSLVFMGKDIQECHPRPVYFKEFLPLAGGDLFMFLPLFIPTLGHHITWGQHLKDQMSWFESQL